MQITPWPQAPATRSGKSIYLLVAYALTLPAVLIADAVVPSADLVSALKLVCLAAFGWHALAVTRDKAYGASLLALAAALGMVWTTVCIIRAYQWVTMTPLDFAMILGSLSDSRRTVEHVLGPHGVMIIAVALIGMVGAASAGALLLLSTARRFTFSRAPGRLAAAICVALVAFFALGDLSYAVNELAFFPRSYGLGSRFPLAPPLIPDYSTVHVRSDESVIILQLESVNSLVLFEPTRDGKSYRSRIPQPGLSRLVQEGRGVLFPRFWSNGAHTNRAWESILCGVSGNLGPPIAQDPDRLGSRPCLPAHLAQAGYTTVFLYSYFNTDFFNLGGFARAAGFRDLAYGPALMHQDDRRYAWGYDDCVFYERAFDYLAAKGLAHKKRLFAYLEVGTNHFPFHASRKHPEAHPYPDPRTPLEDYLNSVAEQDYCLLTFWKRFRELGRDDVHLIVVPDHSLWIHETLDDNDAPFSTWLAYVPPARRAAEFVRGMVLAPVPSQAELYPTLLELLGGERSPRSFAFALRGERAPPDYDSCRQMSEPNRRLVVRRGTQRREYRFRTDQLLMYQGAAQAADYRSFYDRFACK